MSEKNQDKCDKCKGEGFYPDHDPNDPHEDGCSNCPIKIECEDCFGTGIKGMHQCQYCGIMTTQPDHECYKCTQPMTTPNETIAEAKWTYCHDFNKSWFEVWSPETRFLVGNLDEATAKFICNNFNTLSTLQRQLSESEKELPSEEVIMEWFPQRDDEGRFITKNIHHRGGARRMRSEASKTIAGLQSQLSDKEKENERLREALKAFTDACNKYNLEMLTPEYEISMTLLTLKQG